MRGRVQRIIEIVESKGEFGTCTCSSRVLYYSDFAVKCESCGKLYGVWGSKGTQNAEPEQNALSSEKSSNVPLEEKEVYARSSPPVSSKNRIITQP